MVLPSTNHTAQQYYLWMREESVQAADMQPISTASSASDGVIMSECERLWDARAKAWRMNVIIGKLQNWFSPNPTLKKWLIKDLIKHPIPIPYYSSTSRPTTPLLPLPDSQTEFSNPAIIFSSRVPSIMANCPPACNAPLPNPLKAPFLAFLFLEPNVNRNPRCKIERDWNPKPRERCCVNECICVAPERVLIYLTLLIQALFITYRHYRLVHYSHPSYIPCVQFNRWWSCNELPCATNCLFRASTQWWSE